MLQTFLLKNSVTNKKVHAVFKRIVPETSYDRISADYESIVIRNKNLGVGFELLELTG